MSEFVFKAQPPLSGLQRNFDGVALTEVTDRALISVATPTGGKEQFAAVILAVFETAVAPVGQSTVSPDGRTRLLGMQRDQIFALLDHASVDAITTVKDKLGEAAYCTDQSDSWALLRVAGPKSRSTLERICPIDLHQDVFALGAVARTQMEHLATIIVCEGRDEFLLMSPRSSARSFLHALETSVRNID